MFRLENIDVLLQRTKMSVTKAMIGETIRDYYVTCT